MYTATSKENLREYLLKSARDLEQGQIYTNTFGMPFIAIPLKEEVVAAGKKFPKDAIFLAHIDGNLSVAPPNGLGIHTKQEFNNKQEVLANTSSNNLNVMATANTVEDAVYKSLFRNIPHYEVSFEGKDGSLICKYTIPSEYNTHISTAQSGIDIMKPLGPEVKVNPKDQAYTLKHSQYIGAQKYDKKAQQSLLEAIGIETSLCDALLKSFHQAKGIDEKKEIMEQIKTEKSILHKAIDAAKQSEKITLFDKVVAQELEKQIDEEIKKAELEMAIAKTRPPQKTEEKTEDKVKQNRENPYVLYLYGMLCMSCNLHQEEAMQIASQLSNVQISGFGDRTKHISNLNANIVHGSPDISDLGDGNPERDIYGNAVNGGSITNTNTVNIAELTEMAKATFYKATGIPLPPLPLDTPSYMDGINHTIATEYDDPEEARVIGSKNY